MVETLYDAIGRTYTATRRPDPRLAVVIRHAVGDARSIVNIGAGAGAYEPGDVRLVAVEPSWRMIHQRPRSSAPVVRAIAEALPFAPETFDVALAVFTLHHWTDWRRGLDEMRRVARRLVVLTFDADAFEHFWLTSTYFPQIIALDRHRGPSLDELRGALDRSAVSPVFVPHDCRDGFLAAFWRRPERYLEVEVRAGMSGFSLLEPAVVERGVERLARDLRSGAWDDQFGFLRSRDEFDAGYRLLVTS